MLKEAMFYRELENGTAECFLCVLNCKIKEGKKGKCRVRKNIRGKLYSLIYGELTSFSVDYIEKAPLYHFYPSHKFLNVGSAGCNLNCKFCLAWTITQVEPEKIKKEEFTPEKIVEAVKAIGCKGIVYTHSEPTLNLEFYAEVMKLARREKLKNVFATNGFISQEAFNFIAPYVDAVALTFKGGELFYKEICNVKFQEKHFVELCREIKKRKIHLELVYVLIPGFNDSKEEIEKVSGLANEAPLIFLRFFPSYRMDKIESPKEEELERALEIAHKAGVKHAYIENIFSHPGKHTYCEHCGRVLIRREGFGVVEYNVKKGKCAFCGAPSSIVGEPILVSAKL